MNKSKIKSIISLVLAILLCISVSACSNDSTYEKDNSKSKSSETYDAPHENDYEPSYEEPTTPVTDLGFYNLDELTDEYGNCIWIGISGWNSNDGGYIYRDDANGGGYLFKSGFIQAIYDIYYDSDLHPSYKVARGPYAYTAIDNDGIAFAGDGSVLINDRINISDKATIFICQSHFRSTNEVWIIPATMIDWSTKDENFTMDGKKYTRYYLK